jgi:hypothetical protein
MQEQIKKYFTQFLLLLFVAESILTPLGFCGHSHANSASAQETCCLESRTPCCPNTSESTSHHTDEHQKCPSDQACHCLCALKLVSVVFAREIQIDLAQTPFYALELQIKPPEIIQNIFHPPRN